MKKIIQLIGLSLIIVVLPAASWYFLKSGLDYRMESMDKLGDFGQLATVDLELSNGKQVNTDFLKNQIVVVHPLQSNADTSMIMKFYRQFAKRNVIHFIFNHHDDLRLKADRVDNLWLLPEGKESAELFKGLGKAALDGGTTLIDIEGKIRNYYDLDSETELRQLVEHTAFLLPVEETAKPEMIRETEK